MKVINQDLLRECYELAMDWSNLGDIAESLFDPGDVITGGQVIAHLRAFEESYRRYQDERIENA